MTDINSGAFTPTGLKVEAPFENNRNAQHADLFKAIIREAYGAGDVIIAHHLTYVTEDMREDGTYEVVEEIPSADTLIFDHDVAQKLWGDAWKETLQELAIVPVPERDEVLRRLYYGRARMS